MTEQEISDAQIRIERLIAQKAKELHGDGEDSLMPIYDGVCDPEKYLKSSPRIMWILKEAYDGIDDDGNPFGGGWHISKDWTAENIEPTKSQTWQPMMYAIRALTEENYWEVLPWIRDDRETYMKHLMSCAYINVNKMPAKIKSGDLSKAFDIWENIITEQILAYKPKVIIFGNTFEYFRACNFFVDMNECNGVENKTGVYTTQINGQPIILIDAYHPNQRLLSRQDYVDSIVESVRMNSN